MTELKPCPCCGSKNVGLYDFGLPNTMIGCNDCGLRTKLHDDSAQAIAAWNTRAAEEGKAELVEALRHYADTFCEGIGECVGDFCGKLSDEECSGCHAFAALARVRGEG